MDELGNASSFRQYAGRSNNAKNNDNDNIIMMGRVGFRIRI